MAPLGGLDQKVRDGFSAEGGFEGVVGAGGDGLLQLGFAVGPGERVGLFLGERRLLVAKPTRMLVGIEVFGAALAQGPAADAAFARAVDPGQNRERGPGLSGHARVLFSTSPKRGRA